MRDRSIDPLVGEQLLSRTGAPLLALVSKDPEGGLWKPTLRLLGEQQDGRRGEVTGGLRQTPGDQQPIDIGVVHCVCIRPKKRRVKVCRRRTVHGGRLEGGLAFVKEQLLSLTEGQPSVLVADAEVDVITAIGMEVIAGINVEDNESIR